MQMRVEFNVATDGVITVQRIRLVDEARPIVRDAILAGKLAPGSGCGRARGQSTGDQPNSSP
jgi:hypothetical protein